MSHDPESGNDGGTMRFELNWQNGSEDKLGYERSLPEPIDLISKTVRVDIFVPEAYVEDGNMGFQVYTKDSQFRYGNFGFAPVSGMSAGWNTLEYANIENEKLPGAFWADGYDITDVAILGVEMVSNGKPIGVTGDVLVDNVRIAQLVESEGGSGEALVRDDFAEPTSIEKWGFDFGEGLTADDIAKTHTSEMGDGAMGLDISWTGSSDKLLWIRSIGGGEPIDLTDTVIRADIYVPQSYVDDGNLGFKVYTKDTNFAYGSLGFNGVGALDGDAWNTIEIVVNEDAYDFQASGYDMTSVGSLGFDFAANGKSADVTGILYIDNVEIIIQP